MKTLYISNESIFNDDIVCSLILSKNPFDYVEKAALSDSDLSIDNYLKSIGESPLGEIDVIFSSDTLNNMRKRINFASLQLVCNRPCYKCGLKTQNVLHYYCKTKAHGHGVTDQRCRSCMEDAALIAHIFLIEDA